MRRLILIGVTGVFFLMTAGLPSLAAKRTSCRVLVVMSYDPAYNWVVEVKEGIESVLSGTCQITYFYLDTKQNLPGGPQKAREAYALYQKLKPDGVIAVDDNAQSMFVVPYLKDKVKTPVMFCGVNAEPEQYGYPGSNVSGILERFHVSQSLALATQLLPSLKTFAFFVYDSPTGKAVLEELNRKAHTFPVRFVAARMPKNLNEMLTMANEVRDQCDTLFIPTLQGITDKEGRPLSDREIIPVLAQAFGKPIIGGSSINIKYGILCGVVESGQEQGATAARMLKDAMAGTPVAGIPITTNRRGRVMINVTVLKAFGIKPKAIHLKGAEFIESVK